jgi:beta-xylosidase
VNNRHEVDLLFSNDGENWHYLKTVECSGYHHNVFGGFRSLRPELFCIGDGKAEFRNFSYRSRVGAARFSIKTA